MSLDVFPKFVIVAGDMIVAKVTYHRQLVESNQTCIGGGWWELDTDKKTMTLTGSSDQFGKASLEDIKRCVEAGRVYPNTRRSPDRKLTDKFTFKYRDEYTKEIIDL